MSEQQGDSSEKARRREVALSLSVAHYGYANHSDRNIPARPDSIVRTAQEFERYLSGETPDSIFSPMHANHHAARAR